MFNKLKAMVKKQLITHFSMYHITNKNKFCGLSNLTRIDTLVDVGANAGGFSKKLPHILGIQIRNLILVEPDKRYEQSLNDLHVSGVQTKNIQMCCISDIEGETIFNIFGDGALNSLLTSDKFGKVLSVDKVKSITGDLLLSQDPHFVSTEVNILKIDVQGAENVVLESFSKTLGDFNFIILEISFSDFYENQSEFVDLIKLLDSTHKYSGNLSEVYGISGAIDYINAVFHLRTQK